ncbi:MAG: adenosylmethionine---8-amino-7-oxononanoate aminotransferase [Solirubrobacteraceae bacterium]|nr:adenosylmethionine---8-amino-7-oxononanoate aminotransferase [Solirubrobacteraceae bacterium]
MGVPDWPALLDADRRHVWHPYGPMPGAQPVLPVVAAEGTRLTLADGRELIDAMSSWWCAIHGHRHPAIVAAMHTQLDTLPHVMFGGLTHEPAIELATTLVGLAPGDLEHVFFADSGSVSVEVAIKLCLQARPGRTKLLTIRGGYHGDTFGAMAVCDPDGGMHRMWSGLLPEHVFAPRPPRTLTDEWAAAVHALAEDPGLAAIIVEPVVQGAGGMWFYDPAALQVLRDAADAHDLLLVYDEIATGFGRTGDTLFAGEHVPPDVMCVGKALTGGTMTLAATLCTPRVAAALDGGPLMHGPTFMANPLACAAARASLALLDGWQGRVTAIEAGLTAGLAPARRLPGVADVRVRGAIGVVQLDRPVDVPAATAVAVDRGVWLRPFRDLLYVMPPYVCSEEEVAAIAGAVVATAA